MKKIRVGQIGRGSFGKKILSKLENIPNVSVEWVYGSADKWWEFDEVDWVIIASPNEFHYEQAKHYLELGYNVLAFSSEANMIEELPEHEREQSKIRRSSVICFEFITSEIVLGSLLYA